MHVQGTALHALILFPLRKKKKRVAESCKSCVGLCHLLNDCRYQEKERNQRGGIVALQCVKLA